VCIQREARDRGKRRIPTLKVLGSERGDTLGENSLGFNTQWGGGEEKINPVSPNGAGDYRGADTWVKGHSQGSTFVRFVAGLGKKRRIGLSTNFV